MSDYISREEAYQQMLDLQTRKKERYLDIDDVRKVLHKMPRADVRENRWIPVSERLPEDYDRVLITVNGCRGLIVREARYYKARNEFEVLHNHERWKVEEKGLLAWMPLPEPYKADKGEIR